MYRNTLKVTIVFALLVVLSKNSLLAQQLYTPETNRFIPPSPTAASLGKYGEFPINLYSGLINIGEHLYTIKSGSLSMDISLSYHHGGNRPSDIPGWVGLGFSLNAGGVITRNVNGLPDDKPGGYYTSSDKLEKTVSKIPVVGSALKVMKNASPGVGKKANYLGVVIAAGEGMIEATTLGAVKKTGYNALLEGVRIVNGVLQLDELFGPNQLKAEGGEPDGKLSRISTGEINEMKGNGFDPHGEKPKQNGPGGKIDIWKDSKGFMFFKTEKGAPQPLYENISTYL